VFVNGARASFLLDLPKQYDKRRGYPLLLAFRGPNQTSEEFRSELNLTSIADAIVVYANPLDPYADWQFQRDVVQVDALLEKLGDAYCVDQDRVFALGKESGSMLANWLGCVRGDRMRAVATLTSAPPPPEACIGSAAVWLLQRTDTDPMTVGNGYGNRDFWAFRNGCDMTMAQAVAGTSCVDYAACVPDIPVRFCEHRGAASPSFAASAAWQFFSSL
jgi:polyhydroxybutyrate depolymerase